VKRNWTVILLVLMLGCLLRIWTIGKSSLWFDEAFTRDAAHYSDPLSLLQQRDIGDTLPPLHLALLSAWWRITGDSEVSLRMLSALFGMLAIPAYFHLGRLMFGELAGTIAVTLGALSPMAIAYAQEVRFYAQSIFFGAWVLVGLIAIIRGKRYGFPLYLFGAIGGLYTHYFIGVMLAAAHLGLLLYRPARERWRQWLAADLIAAIAFLPQVAIFLRQASAILGSFWIAKPNIAQPFTTTPLFLLYGATLPAILANAGIVILVITVVTGGFDLFRYAPPRVRAYWMLGIGTILLTLLIVLVVSDVKSSIYLDRSFAVLSGPLIVLIAGGAAYARRPSPVPILIAGLIVLMVAGDLRYALTPNDSKPPFRQIAADIVAQPDALTTPIIYLHDATFLPMDYYVPALSHNSILIDLGTRSWLYPADVLYPTMWTTFGANRVPLDVIERDHLQGTFRVIMAATVAPEDFLMERTLVNRLTATCATREHDYPPAVSVWEFNCP